jgi:phage-related protein
VTSHTLDGFYLHTKDEYLYDLINIPAKKTVELWVNVYQVGFDTYECEEYAKNDTRRGLFARKKITFEVEEGEGL